MLRGTDRVFRSQSVSSPQALEDDPLRVLRAIRLTAHLKFTLEGATEALLASAAHGIQRVAGERIRDELLGFFTLATPATLSPRRRSGWI